MFAPYYTGSTTVQAIMFKVLAALVPAVVVYVWWFGPAILVTLLLASATALAAEYGMLKLRRVPVAPFLLDGSALLTGWLLALSVPPMAPWWIIVGGTAFALVVAKHLYGGLGNNPFNPAMVGYAALIVSYPVQMTQWLAPEALAQAHLGLADTLRYMFGGALPPGIDLDAVTLATPLDTLKTQLHAEQMIGEIRRMPIFGAVGGKGGEALALAYLAGGLYLLQQRIITWHQPAAFLAALFFTAALFYGADADRYAPPLFHLAAGAAMIGAFFIVTDPVSGPTTPKGKLIFAGLAGMLTYFIRVFGGYPDGVAFAVLIMNVAAPLIEAYTQPPVFGKKDKARPAP